MAGAVSRDPSMTDIDLCAFQHSPPHSMRQSSTFPLASSLDFHDLADVPTLPSGDDRPTSAHSSISSFPVSVIQPLEYAPLGPPGPRYAQPLRNHSTEGFATRNVPPRVDRCLGLAFRHPSSVEEMQMKDDDSESLLVCNRRRGSHVSTRSHERIYSPRSSPSKRQSYSSQLSPLKGSKLRKEFPLVLLHCSILPPSNATMPPDYDSELYAALLPVEYRARWNTLHDKLADPEMKTRGILISHPQEDYELLEERLLESLELDVPRIRSSHFFHDDRSAGDSGFESGSQPGDESNDEALKNGRCPDCGKCLHLQAEDERKWEVKVYAANGLMRAGAWAAAWRDMEKVDVEISLAMPDDVRREVNSRLEVLRSVQDGEGGSSAAQSSSHQDFEEIEIDFARHEASPDNDRTYEPTIPLPPSRREQSGIVRRIGQHPDIFRDRKNILITLLSMLVLFYAMTGSKPGMPFAVTTQIAPSRAPKIEPNIITSTSVLSSVSVQTIESSTLAILEILPSTAQPMDGGDMGNTDTPDTLPEPSIMHIVRPEEPQREIRTPIETEDEE